MQKVCIPGIQARSGADILKLSQGHSPRKSRTMKNAKQNWGLIFGQVRTLKQNPNSFGAGQHFVGSKMLDNKLEYCGNTVVVWWPLGILPV